MSTDNTNVNINMELLKLTHIKYAIGLHVKELQEVCNAIKSIDDFPHNIKDECGEVEVVSEGFITFLNNLTKKITEEIQNSTIYSNNE